MDQEQPPGGATATTDAERDRGSGLTASEVAFPNGSRSQLVRAGSAGEPAEVLRALGMTPPAAVLLVIGGAGGLDPDLRPRLDHLFTLGVVRAAAEAGAVVLDGGTQAGVMAVLGEAAADRRPRPTLIGVAPEGKVTYAGGPDGTDLSPLEPNHSHFALVDGSEWGTETELLIGLAEELSAERPAVALVVGGGTVAGKEARQAVLRGWPLVILEGTGGLADELASAALRAEGEEPSADPILEEIVADGDLEVFSSDGDAAFLRSLLGGRLKEDETLRMAWGQFAVLNQGAIEHQRRFRQQHIAILTLGVLGTGLALMKSSLDNQSFAPWLSTPLRYLIIAIPIIVAAMVAAAARFRPGSRWVVLRGTAEAIKGEIYRYRAGAGIHSSGRRREGARPVKLAEAVGGLMGALMHTEANLASFDDYEGPMPPRDAVAAGDDGMTPLSPERYIELRIDDQIGYYRRTARRLERKLRRLRWGILVVGGLGTFLAAVGFELWIALTLAVAGALATYLESGQVETSLMHCNQAAADLLAIRAWWLALPARAQMQQTNIDRLVEQAERIMRSEQSGWVQEMQDVIARLRLEEEPGSAASSDGPSEDRTDGGDG